MYAIVQRGTKQWEVEPGKTYQFDKMAGNAGDTITFDEVLLVVDGEKRHIGTPVVKGATVSGKIVGEIKGKKVIHFRYRRRKSSKKKKGHRQQYTVVAIERIAV